MTAPAPLVLARRIALVAGPLAGCLTWALCRAGDVPVEAAQVAGLTVLVAAWWIFEPIPIPFTSLLPLALLPLAGILTAGQVGAAYGDPLILLLLGGFMLSQGLVKSGVHRRLALGMVRAVGGRAGRPLVFGFMLAAAMLSLGISNTATALMLLPIALATLEPPPGAAPARHRRQDVAVLLGIAYGASVGGMGTPIGTPPNLIFMEAYREATGITLGFTGYMAWALPVVFLFVPASALWLTRGMGAAERLSLPDPGPWQPAEKRVLTVFALVALAWVTRTEPFGGWSRWLDLPGANDASVALLGCVAMALVPDGRGGRLLDWDHAVRVPWGILLLFGAGITLAAGFENSGLSELVGQGLGRQVGQLPMALLVVALCLAVTFCTEVTSNTALATLLMPIIAAVTVSAGIDPLLPMLAVSMSASCAFMLPVATGPNAVVFGTGRLTVAEMAREGLVVNLIGVVVISAVLVFWVGAAP